MKIDLNNNRFGIFCGEVYPGMVHLMFVHTEILFLGAFLLYNRGNESKPSPGVICHVYVYISRR